uniref:Uncharacterized protein n=1 Tax=Timema shepardi TaxID=629360 RepID=A0A7R9B5P7_TIMSH|nr:unnamed protein product [Timema shepardi]
MSCGHGLKLRSYYRVSAFVIFLMVVSMFYIPYSDNWSNRIQQVDIEVSEKNYYSSMSKDGYLVWTPSCQIPEIDPYDPSIKNMLSRSDPIICSKHGPLTYVTTRDNSTSSYSLMIDSGMISQYVPPHQKLFCCYSIVTRVTVSTENYNSSADNLYSISTCNKFDKEVELEPNEEFILVKCHSKKTSKSSKQKEVYNNMHAVVQKKESIISKLEENNKRESCEDSRKLNVILVGLDSMSRSSLIRLMPNTVSHLRHNGWTELKGYNKIGDNTFPNLMAILTGYSVKELEHLCWPGRKSKMDDCPFLWKDFSRQGYVTAYVEDEPEIVTIPLRLGESNVPLYGHFVIQLEVTRKRGVGD